MKKDVVIGEGRPINSPNDIVDFLTYMNEKYSIKQELGIITKVVGLYLQDPTDKDHIAMNNIGDEWYMAFLSDEDVLMKWDIDEDTKVYS